MPSQVGFFMSPPFFYQSVEYKVDNGEHKDKKNNENKPKASASKRVALLKVAFFELFPMSSFTTWQEASAPPVFSNISHPT